MPPPHVIRLRSPWTQSVTPGTLSIVRGFNCPTGLDGSQQVWLVIDDLPASGTAYLNDFPLGSLTPHRFNQFEITTFLAPRNQIRFELSACPGQEPLPEPTSVRLEIRDIA